jgi:hypothetical protein
MIVVLAAFAVSSCASYAMMLSQPKQVTYTIAGSSFDDAYSAGIKAAALSNLNVFTSDSKGGTFLAHRGGGFAEITEFNFVLMKTDGKLQAMIRADSSDAEGILTLFGTNFRSLVKVEAVN